MQVQGPYPQQWAPFQETGLAARMADLTPDLQVSLDDNNNDYKQISRE